MKTIKKLLKWSLHLSEDSFNEPNWISVADQLLWNNVGYGTKLEVTGAAVRTGANEAKPFFSDYKGYQSVWFF
jgi:hypothetical protein